MNRTVGIDLGTTNSAGVVLKDGRMRIVPSEEGPTAHGKMFPSVVAFKPDGGIVVGKRALEYSYVHPERVVRWIKRKMGTDYTVSFSGMVYTPQEVSAIILKKIKRDAEKFIGETIGRAVIAAPAYFNNNQRNATREAGELAGFEVLRIMSEPTAAALSYGLNHEGRDMKVAVLDLGAGTFDITLLELTHDVFSVLSTSGDTLLGGKDMDDLVLEYLVQEIRRKYFVDVGLHPLCMSILREASEEAKIRLSQSRRVSINPELRLKGETLRPCLTLTRNGLGDLVGGLVDRMEEPLKRALEDAGLTPEDIDRLVLVGGPTKMPIVRRKIKEVFGIEPEEGIDPMSVVATGAFIQASMLNGEIRDMLLLDVVPLSLGLETSGGVFTRLIQRNTTIPTEVRHIFATEEDGQTSMMIHVLQGERSVAKGNTSLGLFRIDGIPPAPRFEQKAEITFCVDADGILTVSAEVLTSGDKITIPVRSVKELTQFDIAQRIIEATRFDNEDSRFVEEAHVRENAEALLFEARKVLESMEDSLTAQEEERYIEAIDMLTLSLRNRNISRIRKWATELSVMAKMLTSKAKTQKSMKLLVSTALGSLEDTLNAEARQLLTSSNVTSAMPHEEVNELMRRVKGILLALEVDERGREYGTH